LSQVRGVRQPNALRFVLLALVIDGLAAPARPAGAQTCAGLAPFNLASPHFEFNAGTNSGGHAIGIGVGHGTDTLFGIGTLLARTADQADRVYVLTGTLGTDQPLSPDNKFRFCPLITLGYISDSNLTRDDDGRFGVSVAGEVSMLVVNRSRMRVLPTIGLDLRKNVGRTSSALAQDARRTYHSFTGGIGFLVRNQLSLVPRVVFPFGSIGRTAVQVTVGYNVIRR
jgi:hypothetical protein